jgi:hypothetical protein
MSIISKPGNSLYWANYDKIFGEQPIPGVSNGSYSPTWSPSHGDPENECPHCHTINNAHHNTSCPNCKTSTIETIKRLATK